MLSYVLWISSVINSFVKRAPGRFWKTHALALLWNVISRKLYVVHVSFYGISKINHWLKQNIFDMSALPSVNLPIVLPLKFKDQCYIFVFVENTWINSRNRLDSNKFWIIKLFHHNKSFIFLDIHSVRFRSSRALSKENLHELILNGIQLFVYV